MKKLTMLASALALFFFSCTKDAAVDNDTTPSGGSDRQMTIIGSTDESTRTQFSEGTAGFVLNWVAQEDKIGLYVNAAGSSTAANLPYSADHTAAKTTFTADGQAAQWSGESDSHDFYAYYPYNAEAGDDMTAVPISVPAVQTQSEAGNTEHLASLDFLYAVSEDITMTPSGSVSLQFNHPLSMLEFSIHAEQNVANVSSLILRCTDPDEILSAEGASIDLTTGVIDYASAEKSNQIELKLASAESFSAGEQAKKFHAQITPGHAGKLLQVIAVADGSEILLGTKFVPASGIPAGKRAKINFGVSSKVRLSDNGTANCYIVSSPATQYMFNATVKGNGKAVTYNWTDGSGTAMSKTVSAADIAIKPRSAKLLWTTNSATSTVIEDVTYDSSTGMISFQTPASFIDGNAVIAAYASDDCTGDVLWSWHIWAVENYDADLSAIALPAKSVLIMDRNLGATLATEQSDAVVQSRVAGLTYQWGRKDPFPKPAGNMTWGDAGNGAQGELTYSPDGSIAYGAMYGGSDRSPREDKVLYQYYAYNDGMQQVKPAELFSDDMDGALAQSVKEPWRYHANASGGVYTGASTNNYAHAWLWGNPTGNNDGGSKSIYDPCPVGYKVAPRGVYEYLRNTTVTYSTYGTYCGDIYFSRTGRRTGSSGFFENCNSETNIWSDHAYNPYGYATAAVFNTSNSSSSAWATYPAYGMAVRCVSEEQVDMSQYAENLSRSGTANCYIVNKPATFYKFDATVKGNGVSPVGESTTIMPAKARILWGVQEIELNAENPTGWPVTSGADATLSSAVIYSSLQLKDGYVYFQTADNMKNGNLVICVTDANEKILWSWHIWVVNGYEANVTAQQVNLTKYGSSTTVQCTLMDRNLGATCNPVAMAAPSYSDYAHARGMFYQWGRKDPFVHMRSMNGFNPTVSWSAADGTITSALAFYSGAFNDNFVKANDAIGVAAKDLTGALNYVTANPMVFIKAGNSYTWLGPGAQDPGTEAEWGKLWGNQGGGVGAKTMYDPCPAGWRVPDPKALWFITSHADNIGAAYAKPAPWKLNCKETIYDAQGNNVGAAYVNNAVSTVSPFTAEPWGLHFFIHGTKTPASGEDYDQGNLPADQTVTYFPAQGMIRNNGEYFSIGSSWAANNVVAHTNAPDASTSYGGRTKLMLAAQNGDFFYNASAASYAEQQNTGRPVRCIKE